MKAAWLVLCLAIAHMSMSSAFAPLQFGFPRTRAGLVSSQISSLSPRVGCRVQNREEPTRTRMSSLSEASTAPKKPRARNSPGEASLFSLVRAMLVKFLILLREIYGQLFVFVFDTFIQKPFMYILNKVEIKHHERLTKLISSRPRGTPLITVSNHCSSLDEPLLFSTLIPWPIKQWELRYSLCHDGMFFRFGPIFAQLFFYAARGLPIYRNRNMYPDPLAEKIAHSSPAGIKKRSESSVRRRGKVQQQKGEKDVKKSDLCCRRMVPYLSRRKDLAAMEAAQRKSQVTTTFKPREYSYLAPLRLGPLRPGVGKLIAYCEEESPVVLPFYHTGMHRVLPQFPNSRAQSFPPKTGNKVIVRIGVGYVGRKGEPIQVKDLLDEYRQKREEARKEQGIDNAWTTTKVEEELYAKLTNRVEEALLKLSAEVDVEEEWQTHPSVLSDKPSK